MITFRQEDDRFFICKGSLEVWFPKATKETVVSSVIRMVAITEQSFGDYLMKKVKNVDKSNEVLFKETADRAYSAYNRSWIQRIVMQKMGFTLRLSKSNTMDMIASRMRHTLETGELI